MTCVGDPYVDCYKVFKGTLTTGKSCTDAAECATTGSAPVACMIVLPDGGNTDVGTCQPVPRGALNSRCASDCYEGQANCSFTQFGGTDPAAPAVCYSEDGLFCDYNQPDSISKCVNVHAMGSACQTDGECGADGYCDYDSTPQVCKPRKARG